VDIFVKLIDRQKNGPYSIYEIIIDGIGRIQGVSEQDCRNMRCSENDYVENCALDIAENKGFKRSNCTVRFV